MPRQVLGSSKLDSARRVASNRTHPRSDASGVAPPALELEFPLGGKISPPREGGEGKFPPWPFRKKERCWRLRPRFDDF